MRQMEGSEGQPRSHLEQDGDAKASRAHVAVVQLHIGDDRACTCSATNPLFG